MREVEFNVGGAVVGGHLGRDAYANAGMLAQAAPRGLDNAIRKPEVEQEVTSLRETIGEVGNMVDTLAARLEPVRRKSGPQSEKVTTNPAPEPMLCDLASQIRELRRVLQGHARVASLVIGELEI